jgi:hypothetical protein
MLHIKAALSLSALAVSGALTAYTQAPKPEPVFIAGSQYSATLHQRSHQWQLLSADGADLNVANTGPACAAQVPMPDGVWLVTRDAQGRPELVAPSVTTLPKGHDGHVRLIACGESGGGARTLAAPKALIDWLSNSAGAVYVDE